MRISSNPIMVRPTLVVGLGGTGVLICRWAEEYLRQLLGTVPPFVRFLKLDTDALEEGGPTSSGESDFINLFHYMDIGEVVRDYAAHSDLHPHLDWMRGLRLDAAFADYGCQGIPRLGRLVFSELRETVIHEAVAGRFSDLRSSTQQLTADGKGHFIVAPDGAPCVHLASSVCGGTGAGLLLDMAYNLRWWSRESFPRAAEIIGHLVLPEAFNVDAMLRSKLEAVAGATIEQIEFLTDSRRDDVPVRYRDGEKRFSKLEAPFNFLYLLNGQGDTGSGSRKHLVKMTARVIRVMTVEPSAQHVTSDANNKLNDILGLMDPANGRRQCFAAYGFWYGTPGHQQADVDLWISSAFEAMCSGPTPEHTDYSAAVREALSRHLDISGKAETIGPPAQAFEWERSQEVVTAGQVEADVRQAVSRYLDDVALKDLEAKAEEALPSRRPNEALLRDASEMIEEDLCHARTEPFGQVGVCLGQWIGQLDRWLADERAGRAPDLSAAAQKALKEAGVELKKLAARLTPLAWTPDDVNPVVNDVLDRHYQAMVEASLRKHCLESGEKALDVLRLRKQALESVATLTAASRMGRAAAHSSRNGGTQRDFFSTPLYSATDPTSDPRSALTRKFRQKLIRPILRQVVLDIKTPQDEVADIEILSRKLKDTQQGLAAEKEQFLKDAEKDNYAAFHSPPPKDTAVQSHPYFKPIIDTMRLAAPKIELTNTGVYARTLDVGITQQMAMTCVPDILNHNVGSTFREAHITDAFERVSEMWFQLLRLQYGFCIEAISTYKNYVAAASDYVVRRGFTFADLWLDSRWYSLYRDALIRWQQDKKNPVSVANLDRLTYDAFAAKIGHVRRVTKNNFESMRKLIHSITDVGKAITAAEKRKQAEMEVNHILESLEPADSTSVDAGLKRSIEIVVSFIEEMEALAARNGPAGLEGKLNGYRRELDACRRLFEASDSGKAPSAAPA